MLRYKVKEKTLLNKMLTVDAAAGAKVPSLCTSMAPILRNCSMEL